jgi:hypothetical protein
MAKELFRIKVVRYTSVTSIKALWGHLASTYAFLRKGSTG